MADTVHRVPTLTFSFIPNFVGSRCIVTAEYKQNNKDFMMIIREMTIDDYEEVYQMWLTTSRRALSEADEKPQLERYLKRNAGMSQVAVIDGKIVGTVLAGHDGRRGFIHHMAVMPEYRRQRIGHSLAEKAIEKIKAEGIDKTHIFSYQNNSTGQSFWSDFGFEKRDDVFVFSYDNNK